MKSVVTRFAPSPTGNLHLGGLRTALINYIIVESSKLKNQNSKFFIRIEDTDKKRSNDDYSKNILEGLKWLGINWERDPIIQSQRIDRHREIAFKLLENGKAFKCVCTFEELESKRIDNQKKQLNIKRLCNECEKNESIQQMEKNFCIRLKIPNHGKIEIEDKIQSIVSINNNEIDNYIILRNDSTPTYMLSVVVDDHDMGVNLIVRGDDHFNNAFRQIYIYKHMNWNIPTYAHIPLIHGEDGTKLSKRHGAIDIISLKKKGYLPQAIINNLILLGWSPKKDNEIININEIIESFNIEKMSKSSSVFSYKKLNYFNNHYIVLKDNFKYLEEFLNTNTVTKEYFVKDKNKVFDIFNIYKSKIEYYSQLEDIIKLYFNEAFRTKNNGILNDEFKLISKEFIVYLNKIQIWNEKNIENNISVFLQDNNINFKSFGKPMRYLLINSINGPSVSEILYALGKKNSFLRINNYINNIK